MSDYRIINKKPIGLVLSGGGVKGLAHVGVIKVMEELGLSADFIAGTSVGAMVGALYAAGHSSDSMLTFFKKTKIFTWHNLTHRKHGLLNPEYFIPNFREYLPNDDFDALQRKLFVSTTDLLIPEGKIFSSGPVILPVLASAAIPGVFSPVEINAGLFADGGIVNNFPIEAIQPVCEKIIGIFVTPLVRMEKSEFTSGFSILQRSYHIGVSNSCLPKFKFCDIMLAPPELEDISTFGTSRIMEAFEIGYKAAKEKEAEFKQLLSSQDS